MSSAKDKKKLGLLLLANNLLLKKLLRRLVGIFFRIVKIDNKTFIGDRVLILWKPFGHKWFPFWIFGSVVC
jgi:hypothetical protein